ncbi:MAG: tRNA lysidine(34) synthetase TilS [Candidatus Symbiothrix sp.]|jgi:tRNA(Ile)-lysidine synthase|nr:tRNA lysidine(34) synthetase TilS [Candidatus Symbiothrix sp.]
MIRTVRQYIAKHQLLRQPQAKIIVGVSGGADSVVLLYVLQRLGYDCVAAHCNFHLRKEESDADEQLVYQLAADWKIPYYKEHFDTRQIAEQQGISIEMAARNLRYAWFEQLRQQLEAEAIAVAHHEDDSIETMLINLIRGTGIKGLTGISPKVGYVIRPLLGVSKPAILHFAAEKTLPYRTDSSNLQDTFTRNKIRLNVLPLLQSINPSVRTALLRTMKHLDETNKLYEQAITDAKEQVFNAEKGTIDIPLLQQCASPEAVLFEILKDYGFNEDVVQDAVSALNSQSGKTFQAPNFTLIRDRKYFLLVNSEQHHGIAGQARNDELPINNDALPQLSINHLPFTINHLPLTINKTIAYFDADLLQLPLTLRHWQRGDKFVPFGMTSFQKVSDYFTNNKFSLPEKEKTWLLCSGEDIIWIVGHRADNRFRITDKTKNALIVNCD